MKDIIDSEMSHTSSQLSPKTKRANRAEMFNTVIPVKNFDDVMSTNVRRPNKSMIEKAKLFITWTKSPLLSTSQRIEYKNVQYQSYKQQRQILFL